MTDDSSTAVDRSTDNSPPDLDRVSDGSSRETHEWPWLLGMFVLSAVVAGVLVHTIPVVSELPKGVSSPLEYAVKVAVARFGGPVVFLLFLASLMTALGHNKGKGRSGLDFAAKVCSFGAATFSLWVVGVALMVGVI